MEEKTRPNLSNMLKNVSFDTADYYSATNDTHFIFDDDAVDLSKEERHNINVTLDWGDVHKWLSKSNNDSHTLESCKKPKSDDVVSSERGVNAQSTLQGTTATFVWAFSPLNKNYQSFEIKETPYKLKSFYDEHRQDSSPKSLLNASAADSVSNASFSSEDDKFDGYLVKLSRGQGITVAEEIYYAAIEWFSKKYCDSQPFESCKEPESWTIYPARLISCKESESFPRNKEDTQHSSCEKYDASLTDLFLNLSAISHFDDTVDDDDDTDVHVNALGALQGTAVAGEKLKNVYDKHVKDPFVPSILSASITTGSSSSDTSSSSSEDENFDDALVYEKDNLMLSIFSRCLCLY